MRRKTGTYVRTTTAGETVDAFVPAPLPPTPPLDLDAELVERSERAHLAFGRLDGLASALPDPALFLYFFVRREAVLSSQIEGTQSSLADLLLFEQTQLALPGIELDDVREVSACVAAIDHGIRRLREGFPLSTRLLREVHAILLDTERGRARAPGEIRRSQNWVGGSRPGNAHFVPPPPTHLADCLSELERFLHDQPARVLPLLKAGLAHVQFETIHPFLDGNGRVGRLLITLVLSADESSAEGLLREPLLYPSLLFRQQRQEYYDRLDRVRTEGDWEGWLGFFLDGVEAAATDAVKTARAALDRFEEDRAAIARLGRPAGSCLQLHDHLKRNPVTSIQSAAQRVPLTEPTLTAAMRRLEELDIVEEITGRKRGRIYRYRRYVGLLAGEEER
ncbi:MAG TPA: Fic family protein [Thermoanaerobaculia bacterium]|nr:Fic family protein [Thermoanaerobaculia bacterium]